jgi:hypothetical protein
MFNFLSPYMMYLKIALAITLVGVGFISAFTLQQKKIDGLNERLGGYEQTISSMTALTLESNTKIESMAAEAEKRKEEAAKAIASAQSAADDAETIAHAILTKKPPKGINQCLAAQSEFRDELRRERGLAK